MASLIYSEGNFELIDSTHEGNQTRTPVPRRQHRFEHHVQARGLQADSVLRRQLGQQSGQRRVDIIVRHDDMQRY